MVYHHNDRACATDLAQDLRHRRVARAVRHGIRRLIDDARHLPALIAASIRPGSNESAGRQRSGRTRKGNAWLKTALVQAAHGAARMKGTALAAKYQRVAARRGAKRAIMAVAHRLLIIAYHVIARREPYHELGADYLERRRPAAVVDRLLQRLRQLGVDVTVTTGTPSGGPPAGAVLAATP